MSLPASEPDERAHPVAQLPGSDLLDCVESLQARESGILQFSRKPINDDPCHFVDGLGGDEQGLGCGQEVKEGGLFPGLLWSVLRFVAAGKRGDDKTLLFEAVTNMMRPDPSMALVCTAFS